MSVRTLSAELVHDAQATLGEGPLWDSRTDELMWVDITRGHVHRFDAVRGSDQVMAIGQPVGAIGLRAAGGFVIAVRDGFGTLDGDGLTMLTDIERDRPRNRMNDGKVDPAGRFWAGTMALDSEHGAGSLYCLDEGRVRRVLAGLTIPNGLDWADARTMYFIDSTTGGVDAFDYDMETGGIGRRRRAIGIAASTGLPDGMTLDAEGCLWVAIWDGSAIHRYRPDGALDAVVKLPVSQPTSCAFGDGDLRTLYITSAREELTPGESAHEPHAGGLFACRPGVAGLPAHRYKG